MARATPATLISSNWSAMLGPVATGEGMAGICGWARREAVCLYGSAPHLIEAMTVLAAVIAEGGLFWYMRPSPRAFPITRASRLPPASTWSRFALRASS